MKNKTTIYIVMSVLFILGSTALFSSRIYLGDDSKNYATEFNKEIKFDTAELVLQNWIIEKPKNDKNATYKSELEFRIKNYTSLMGKEVVFRAVTQKNPKEQLPVKVKYNNSNYYIIEIDNIPNDYKVIAVAAEIEKELSELEIEQGIEEAKKVKVDLYADYRTIKTGDVKDKTEKEYLAQYISREIEVTDKELKIVNKKIDNQASNIATIKKNIKELEKEKEHQDRTEREKTDGYIEKFNDDIKKAEEDYRILNDQLETLKNKKKELKENQESFE